MRHTTPWDRVGEKLAILQKDSNVVLLYHVRERQSTKLDTQMKDLSHIAWDVNGTMLSVGTGKGNLLLYNSQVGKKIPIMGKHTKRIRCGAWNQEGRLVLGSDDRQVTVSRNNGDTVKQLVIKSEPLEVKFAPEPANRPNNQPRLNQMSINVGGKTLYLYKLGENDEAPTTNNPLELAFQDRYGSIEKHSWFGDGYLLIAFNTGWVVVINRPSVSWAKTVTWFSGSVRLTGRPSMSHCVAVDTTDSTPLWSVTAMEVPARLPSAS